MKISVFAIAGLLIFVTSVSSCKKDTVTNTVTVRDTTRITDTVKPLTKTETLVQQSPWEIQELDVDTVGFIEQYVRGGINSTSDNYGIVRVTFNADGTGSYSDPFGYTVAMNWLFTTQDQSNIQLSLNYGSAVIETWNLVGISDSSIVETNYKSNFIQSAKLVPVP